MIVTHGKRLLTGFAIGMAMTVPGVSGGTVAVICGIYDELLYAVSDFFKNVKYNLILLSEYLFSGLIGFFSMANVISFFLRCCYQPTMFFFIGLILSGSLVLYKKIPKNMKINIPMLLMGATVIIIFHFLPHNLLHTSVTSIYFRFIFFLISGILLAVALILPGVSFSLMLVILGIYSDFLQAVKTFDLSFLLPLGLCTIFGLICSVKVLAYISKYHFALCQSMIIGFVLASVYDLFPGVPHGFGILSCIISLSAGMLVCYLLLIFNKDT